MALSGMTGFARIDGAHGAWRWTLEARSVNGRSLEARFRGPQGFDALERIARDAAQARFQRGQIQISLTAKQDTPGKAISINQALLDQYLDLCTNWIASGQADKPRADGLLALRGVLDQADEQDDPDQRAAVEAAMARDLSAVLDALKAARQAEGQGLLPVLTQHMDAIAARIEAAEAEATAQTDAIRERFTRRLNELLPETPDLSERILQEASVLAVKADVREELDRLHHHVASARSLMAESASQGRRLDFLAQEFMREANTLCSKSATTALTQIGLDLKALVEQWREQIQNVE